MGSDSSSEDDEHIARLKSVAVDSTSVVQNASSSGVKKKRRQLEDDTADELDDNGGLSFSQIRVQNLLHQHLDKTFGRSFANLECSIDVSRDATENDDFDGEIRLFKQAPLGINLQRVHYSNQSCRPKRYESSDEDEPEKLARLRAAAVEGSMLIDHAEKARKKSLDSLTKRMEAAQKAEKDERRRVAALKRLRGEAWLPSVGKEIRRSQHPLIGVRGQVGRVLD